MVDFIGKNSINNLSKILHEVNAKKLLVFTGKKSYESIKPIIEKEMIGYDFTYYNDLSINPKKEEVDSAIEKLQGEFDIILAIGGGSVIDFAKAYRYYTKQLKLIAIPTTCGTGSEATQFAVIYLNGIKYSIDESSILPDYAIVDSQFMEDSPKYLKSCTAMDTYCHAIESYWAIKSTEESRKYAKQAIEICRDYIVKYINACDSIATEKMALASNLSGKAINISRTTAAHALSYKITSKYGIPHGHAVAMSMIDLFLVNQNAKVEDCTDARGYSFVQDKISKILSYIKTTDFEKYWTQLAISISLELDLQKNGINDYAEITNSVNMERLINNPFNISSYLVNFYRVRS